MDDIPTALSLLNTLASTSTSTMTAVPSSSSSAATLSTPTPTTTPKLPSTKSKRGTGKTDAKSKARLNREELEVILSWLEHKPNFSAVYGAQRTTIGLPLKTSIKAYETLASVINKQNKGRLNLTGKSIKERFERHRRLYKKWKELSKATGFGVTEEDHQKGIFSVNSKLEKNCMCFEKMDKLFGVRANVTPLGESDSFAGPFQLLDDNESSHHDSEDDKSADRDSESGAIEDGDEDDENEALDHQHRNLEDQETEGTVVTYRQRRLIQSEEEDFGVDEWNEQVQEWNDQEEEWIDCGQTNVGNETTMVPSNFNRNLNSISEPQDRSSQAQQQEQNSNRRTVKKRKQNTDKRRTPQSLTSSDSRSQKSALASVLESSVRETEVLESLERRKLEIEQAKLDLEYEKVKANQDVNEKQVEIEERRCALEERRQEKEVELEEKRLLLEERKLSYGLEKQRLQLLQSALDKGQDLDKAKELLEFVRSIV
ncbi:hypothetical protein BGZ46_003898 [Entomortierella lignicola]|nr:hypothetical protein BGZ46_003898 [Entomortierella lignicola]